VMGRMEMKSTGTGEISVPVHVSTLMICRHDGSHHREHDHVYTRACSLKAINDTQLTATLHIHSSTDHSSYTVLSYQGTYTSRLNT